MIDAVVEGWHDTARRIRDGGLHGVDVHCSHGHLMQQFLSPLVNRRTDDYGGSRENRLRFLREVLAAVRAGAGPELAVGIRIGHDEGVPGGLTVEDTTWIVKTLEASDAIDYVNLGIGNALKPHTTVAGTNEPPGYQVPKSGAIARAVDVPAIVTGRIMTLEQGEAIIASGQAELVSMVRALHADAELVNKTREGRVQDVRPCISCNHACYAPIRIMQVSACTVNPATGFELRLGEELIERAPEPRRVLVAGGGPAGLEAARVAALRGHQVTLFEAGQRLGGQVDLTRRAPYRAEFGQIIDWLQRQLRKAGVEVRTGVTVTGATIAAEQPDLVIIATGSSPRRDGFQSIAPLENIQGVDAANVLTGWDVLNGSARPGRTVLVFDDPGHYEGIAVVDALYAAGVETVHFVTRTQTLAPAVEFSAASAPARERFGRRDFHFHPTAQLLSIAGGEARLRDLEWGKEESFGFDAAVLLCGYEPNRALASELNPAADWVRSEQGGVYRSANNRLSLVGDALSSPRYLTAAIHEGHHAARWA
jgi:thioredoxin reductase